MKKNILNDETISKKIVKLELIFATPLLVVAGLLVAGIYFDMFEVVNTILYLSIIILPVYLAVSILISMLLIKKSTATTFKLSEGEKLLRQEVLNGFEETKAFLDEVMVRKGYTKHIIENKRNELEVLMYTLARGNALDCLMVSSVAQLTEYAIYETEKELESFLKDGSDDYEMKALYLTSIMCVDVKTIEFQEIMNKKVSQEAGSYKLLGIISYEDKKCYFAKPENDFALNVYGKMKDDFMELMPQ